MPACLKSRIILAMLSLLLIPGFAIGAAPAPAANPFAGADADFDLFTQFKGFRLNILETTPGKPAWADITLDPANFLVCKGASVALCYYSGPEGTTPCERRPDGRMADCTCYKVPEGSPYFVDINAILNLDDYLETVKVCGMDGSDCLPTGMKPAPVCKSINDNKLIPGADLISTFSLYLSSEPSFKLGQTACGAAPYAGCMTAPCTETGETDPATGLPLVSCACPVYNGLYQVGEDDAQCTLGHDLVWSAAYAPDGKTFPTTPSCVPDAPGTTGCPLLSPKPPVIPLVPSEISCSDVCSEYKKSNSRGVEVGYTCDATLCTASVEDAGLVAEACAGLGAKTDFPETILLETAVGKSCSASQICGCQPKQKTSHAIFELNAKQRDRGIVPQCDLNGTLCGQLK
jgi:hypothetical protein